MPLKHPRTLLRRLSGARPYCGAVAFMRSKTCGCHAPLTASAWAKMLSGISKPRCLRLAASVGTDTTISKQLSLYTCAKNTASSASGCKNLLSPSNLSLCSISLSAPLYLYPITAPSRFNRPGIASSKSSLRLQAGQNTPLSVSALHTEQLCTKNTLTSARHHSFI